MKVINVSDSELINRSLQGDPIAYGRLIGRYYESIYHLALRILKDPLDAEEVTQDAFWKAYLSLNSLNKHTSFSSWIMRIAMNLAIDKLRGREDVDYVSLEDLPSEEVMVESFEDEILRKELMEEITRAIEGLPEEDRDLLERYLAGESYRELSERYGKSIGSLKMRVKRAKEKVREKVLKRLSGVVILPWRRIGGMARCMMEGVTAKVAITGIVAMLVAGAGVGIWMSHHGEERATLKAGEVKVERQTSVGAPAMVTGRPEKKEEDDLTFEEFNRLVDEYFNDEEVKATNSGEAEVEEEPVGLDEVEEKADKEVKEEGKDEDAEKLIQQIRYEQLARLLPRHEELQQEYHDLQKMWGYIPGPIFHKREHEICKEWHEVLRELARLFPEAVIYKPSTPGSPGYSSIDYRKLRELVGGRLPVEPYFRP